MSFFKDTQVKQIMTSDNLVVAKGATSLQKAEIILQEHKIEKLPVVDKAGKLIGLITYKDILKFQARPNSCKDKLGRLRVAAAVGVTSSPVVPGGPRVVGMSRINNKVAGAGTGNKP